MISLKMSAYPADEIQDLISRLRIISPRGSTRCVFSDCLECKVKHICYDIEHAIEFLEGYTQGLKDGAAK